MQINNRFYGPCRIGRLFIAALALGIMEWAGKAEAVALDNIALGRPYTFDPQPTYKLCTDPGDMKQLTDGVSCTPAEAAAAGSMWTRKSTVGWQKTFPVVITIDLGQRQPIGGLSYHTAARPMAGVEWPILIFVFVSDDGKNWRFIGDLSERSKRHQTPPAEGLHRFVTHELHAHGRFVSLAVLASGFAFCDEIEVYRAPDSLKDEEPSAAMTQNIREFVALNRLPLAVKRRLTDDLAAVRAGVDEGRLSPIEEQLQGYFQEMKAEIAQLPPIAPERFKAVLPLNPIHEKILAVHGAFLGARGLPPLTVWKQHRYDYLPWLAVPPKAESPTLAVEMMGGEFRADSFLLTNASDEPTVVNIRVSGLPGAPRPDWLRLSVAAWTDTMEFRPVADALVDAEFVDGAFRVPVPAGLTCRVWLTVDSSKLPAGGHEGELLVDRKRTGLLGSLGLAETAARIPISVRVSTVRMARPRLSLCVWDYTSGAGNRGITAANRLAAIELMRSHFVDAPWATSAVLPQTPTPSFAALDEWIKRWPEARRYFVFANVPDHFAGAKIGTPEFDTGVGAWAKTIAGHARELGLAPGQLTVLLVDEPKNDAQAAIIAAWAKAIKAATSELALFEDPVWERPDQLKNQEAVTQVDVLCPNVSVFLKGGAPVAKYFAGRREAGQQLWFYQCSGPVRHFDPQRYYRTAAWLAFQHGAVGIGFWAFGDLGGAPSSWNEYMGRGMSFAPAFLDANGAADSIHWQAVREGVEDYEYLAMLRDAARQSRNAKWKARAEELLHEARAQVTYPAVANYDWQTAGDPCLADTFRLRALKLLEEEKNQPDKKKKK